MNGSILIPEEFRLNKKRIRVKINDDYCDSKAYLGEADFDSKIITLSDKYKGKRLKTETKEKTFYHELVHFIFDACGYEEMKYDEEMVDKIAMKFYEYEKTKK